MWPVWPVHGHTLVGAAVAWFIRTPRKNISEMTYFVLVGHKTSINNFGTGRNKPCLGREWGPHLIQSRLGRGLPPYQVASWCIQPFGHNRNGPKIRGLCCFLGEGSWVPSSTCGLDQGPSWCQVASRSIQPFGHNRHGPKIGEEGAGSPSNTVAWAKAYLHTK